MTNNNINRTFFRHADSKTKADVLAAIATHYGITPDQALCEVTVEESEHLLDYLTGSVRTAASVLMQRMGLPLQGDAQP